MRFVDMMFSPSSTASRFSSRFGLVLVVLIPTILVTIATLNVFYSSGDMVDPGWLASTAWHNNWRLHGPPALPRSYFSEHVSPIFWLTSFVSYSLPLAKFDFFGLVLGLTYGLYAAGIYHAWQWGGNAEPSAIKKTGIAVVVALAATFSAVGMQALRLPHHEVAIPAFALWFFISLTEKKYRQAAICMLLCLMVREDAGFHLFGLLFLWQLTARIFGKPYTDAKKIWVFAAVGFAYSVTAVLLKKYAFDDTGVFQRNYTGTPPWHHITAELMAERWHFYVTERTYIYIPLALTAVWAAIARNPLLPLGYIAFIPWLILSFLATNYTTSTMSYYYAFPFWISLAWPLIALQLWPTEQKDRTRHWPYVLILLPSLVFWHDGHIALYPLSKNNFISHPFVVTEGLMHRPATQRFADYFLAHQAQFESTSLGLDKAVQGLVIDHIGREVWLDEGNTRPDILIYFTGTYSDLSFIRVLKSGTYEYFYAVPDTPIRLASQYDLTTRFPAPQPFIKAALDF